MAAIQNIDPSTTHLAAEDEVYEGKDGVFEVPHALAEQLVGFPHWRYYDGEPWPHPKTREEIEAERMAAAIRAALAATNSSASTMTFEAVASEPAALKPRLARRKAKLAQ